MRRRRAPHRTLRGGRRPAARALTAACAVAALPGLASCGLGGPSSLDPTTQTYHGPLHVAVSHPHQQPKPERYGAAGLALECTSPKGIAGTIPAGSYWDGELADSADGALHIAEDNALISGAHHGYRVAAHSATRVLYVYLVDRDVKQAVIVHQGPAMTGEGWHLESSARCDWSEFPDDVAEQDGRQIWRDASNARVPTPQVVSFTGPEHCHWQSMTFLHLGKAAYVRAPQADLQDFFDQPYREDMSLPDDARDTGYHRDGKHLWVSPDRQLAYVGDRNEVEQWPRTVKPLRCA